MDEKKIQLLLKNFARKRDWQKFHTPKNLAASISIEAAELLEIFQWSDSQLNIEKDKRIKQKISEEVADILLYILRFCDLTNLDVEKICLKKIKINERKYPIALSKGKSTKYNELKRYSNNKFSRRAKFLKENLLKRKRRTNGNNA
tara:strand:- start:115 stop:552 length:438 start_codon:yes stop_codon:yes gene_type:complete